MDLARLYPTVESLPEVPIRIRGMQATRRAAVMGLCAPFLLIGIVCAQRAWLALPPIPVNNLFGMFGILFVIFGMMSLLMPFATWNAEVSRDGVRNVGLFRSRPLIRWDDFQEQRVKEGAGMWMYELCDPTADAPRAGTFAFVSTDDDSDEWLHALIRTVWVRPDPPPPPNVSYTQVRKGFEQRIVLMTLRGLTVIEGTVNDINLVEKRLRANKVDSSVDQIGLELAREALRGDLSYSETLELTEYHQETLRERNGHLAEFDEIEREWTEGQVTWDEIQSVDLWQLEHGRQDILRLMVKLPDKEIEWKSREPGKKRGPNFTGADASELLAMIRQYVPTDRITVAAKNGRPKSLDEWERRVDEIVEKQRRKVRDIRKILTWGPVVMGIGCLLGEWPRSVAFTVVYGPIFYAIYRSQLGRLRKLEADYERWEAELASGDEFPGDRYNEAA